MLSSVKIIPCRINFLWQLGHKTYGPSLSSLQNYSFDSTTPEYGLGLPVYYKRMQGVVASVNGFFFVFTVAFLRQKVSFSVTSFLFPCLIKNASTAFSPTELVYLAYQMLEGAAEAQRTLVERRHFAMWSVFMPYDQLRKCSDWSALCDPWC